MEDGNRSSNPSIHEVSDPARRTVLRGGMGLAATAFFGASAGCAVGPQGAAKPRLGFKGIAASTADGLVVAEGYAAQVLAPWGEPVGIAEVMPAWASDASNSAAEQAQQMGMHHDGLHFYPLDGSRRGLLVSNHEYADDGLLHVGGVQPWTAAKVVKSQAAHGMSVIEVELHAGRWQVVRPSRYARRITAGTPHRAARRHGSGGDGVFRCLGWVRRRAARRHRAAARVQGHRRFHRRHRGRARGLCRPGAGALGRTVGHRGGHAAVGE